MEVTEQLKKGLRHNSAEPEDYLWLSNGKIVILVPVVLIPKSLSPAEKFTEAKYLFDIKNPDVYCQTVN